MFYFFFLAPKNFEDDKEDGENDEEEEPERTDDDVFIHGVVDTFKLHLINHMKNPYRRGLIPRD